MLTRLIRNILELKEDKKEPTEKPCCDRPILAYRGTDITQWAHTNNYECLNCEKWTFIESSFTMP